MLISEEYRQLNNTMHADRPDYGIGAGKNWSKMLSETAANMGVKKLLDYGAGKCTLARSMPLHEVISYDPCIPEINVRPEPQDLVACLDVLEHIEEDCLDAVLEDLKSLTKKLITIVVATTEAKKKLPDGRNAHLIVEPSMWWINKLDGYFDLKQFTDIGYGFLAIMTARDDND